MKAFEIRSGQKEDIEYLVSAQKKLAFESEALELSSDTLKKGVAHVFENPGVGSYLLAFSGGQPIACLLRLFEWSDWRNSNVWWIHSVYVEKDFRSLGVFKKMYLFLKEEVQSREDVSGIRLYVEKNNTKAQKVYKRLGMSGEHYDMYEWLKSH